MPLYEYYCEKCERVFEALRPLSESDVAVPCPDCGRDADRIMPTSFSAMSWDKGYPQRVPYHQRPVRNVSPKKSPVAPAGQGDVLAHGQGGQAARQADALVRPPGDDGAEAAEASCEGRHRRGEGPAGAEDNGPALSRPLGGGGA